MIPLAHSEGKPFICGNDEPDKVAGRNARFLSGFFYVGAAQYCCGICRTIYTLI